MSNVVFQNIVKQFPAAGGRRAGLRYKTWT